MALSLQPARKWVQNVSLRTRLVVIVLLLVTLSLAVTGFASTAALRGYLTERVDDQLVDTARGEQRRDLAPLPPDGAARPERPGRGGPALQSAFYLQVVDASGNGAAELRFARGTSKSPPALAVMDAGEVAARAGRPFTARSREDGDGRWRVLASPDTDSSGAVVVATSLDEVDATVGRLTSLVVTVAVVTLLLLGLMGTLLIRSNLRRLLDVERTAARIAAGDLGQRIAFAGGQSEVGRLGQALNTMLERIETSFAAQQASEAEARQSEERMRRFVADAGHEIRTPLTSIRGFSELHRNHIENGDEPPPQLMGRIESEAARMGALVEDLLLLARLDQQRPLDMQPIDVRELVSTVPIDAAAVAPQHHVSVQCPETPMTVQGDGMRLAQVVSNLVTNAFHHTPQGTNVWVSVEDGGNVVSLAVADDGPGMSGKDAAHVFERFYRSDPSRTRSSGGSGLGLSIVKGIVEAHGGTIDLQTAPNEGTRFIVRLPKA